ncbi:hypothetical protein FOPE_00306 [Fonsecaea pedrosoi]|nr:hypothetical protein FOPE_00306 [Fonsecaea pedrosoi]
MSNTEELKHVLDDMIASYDIEVLPHCAVVVGERTDGRLVTVEVQERRGRRTISGKAFVDCSGDRDLASHADALTRSGKAITAMSTMGSLATQFGGLQNANPKLVLGW